MLDNEEEVMVRGQVVATSQAWWRASNRRVTGGQVSAGGDEAVNEEATVMLDLRSVEYACVQLRTWKKHLGS